jgi:DNA-binding NtrC family response regulator
MNSVVAPRRVLVVGPDPALRSALIAIASRSAAVDGSRSFKSARAHLASTAYDLIVTDVRLAEYNGLHLVYLSKVAPTPAKAIVYDSHGALDLVSEVHRAGAFFEVPDRLLVTLPAYIAAPLPSADRRRPTAFDRRTFPRGGRRLWDRHMLASASAI